MSESVSCACHSKTKMKKMIPRITENILRKIFVGYTGIPVLNKPCNFRGCRDQQNLSQSYSTLFARWFVFMKMKLNFMYVPNARPQYQLTTWRVPDTCQSITFAMQRNIDGIMLLFTQALASPSGVNDSRRYTHGARFLVTTLNMLC